jgi:hypothetical protein
LLIAPNVGVDDVSPSAGDVPAGGTVTVIGRGFERNTKVKLKHVLTSDVRFLDPTHMLVTLAEPMHMHGGGFRLVNADGSETKYFSYLRTARQQPSLNPTLRDTVPLFADIDVTSAVIGVDGQTTGLAIQNRQSAPVLALAALLDANGVPMTATVLKIAPGHFLVQDLSEIFGMAYSRSQAVAVWSLAPVQVMGVAVDAAGNASPIPVR